MNQAKIILITVLATVVIMGGGVYLTTKATSSTKVESSGNAKFDIKESTSFDWGKIVMEKGDVEKAFVIKNSGTDTLKLYNIKTSCHCTIARVEIDGKLSPNFGMSGVSSWIGEIASGKNAKLIVVFDPQYHGPQGVGPINRFVSVETNDPGNPKITFTLTGTVVK